MATGDQQDIYRRMRSQLPQWFGDEATSPVLNGLLQGLAYALAYFYSLLAYGRLQTRIKTATDGWLDMIAADFFGSALLRAANQSDTSFRNRILINLFRERATRAGLIKVLKDLTGRVPTIIEPLRPLDTGVYGGADSISIVSAAIYRNDWQGNQLLYPTARTNLVIGSTNLAGPAWTVASVSVVAGAGPSPDGTAATALAKVTVTGGGSPHAMPASAYRPTVTAAANYRCAVVVSAGNAAACQVRVYDSTVATQLASVTLTFSGGVPSVTGQTGTVGTTVITALPNGTYKVAFGFNTGSFTSVCVPLCYPDTSSTIGNYTYFGLPQSEAGTVDTSYIPTYSTTVTVTDYTLTAGGSLTLAAAPSAGAVLTWTGSYISTLQATTVNVNALQFSTGDGFTTSFSLAPKYGQYIGYGVAGSYGSMLMPYQAFVIAYRPTGAGIPNIAGYGYSTGAYNTASQEEYASLSMIQGAVSDSDIYAAIDSVKPVATVLWTRISN